MLRKSEIPAGKVREKATETKKVKVNERSREMFAKRSIGKKTKGRKRSTATRKGKSKNDAEMQTYDGYKHCGLKAAQKTCKIGD